MMCSLAYNESCYPHLSWKISGASHQNFFKMDYQCNQIIDNGSIVSVSAPLDVQMMQFIPPPPPPRIRAIVASFLDSFIDIVNIIIVKHYHLSNAVHSFHFSLHAISCRQVSTHFHHALTNNTLIRISKEGFKEKEGGKFFFNLFWIHFNIITYSNRS